MDSTPAPDHLPNILRHFSAETQSAYQRFRAQPNATDADIVILAVVRDHMPDAAEAENGLQDESLRLIEDLGFDSVSIAEIVFCIEDLFDVKIRNEEIVRLRTLADLHAFVRQKLAPPPAPSS